MTDEESAARAIALTWALEQWRVPRKFWDLRDRVEVETGRTYVSPGDVEKHLVHEENCEGKNDVCARCFGEALFGRTLAQEILQDRYNHVKKAVLASKRTIIAKTGGVLR